VIGSRPDRRAPAEELRRAFESHYEGLVRLGTLLSGRRELAEDLVQEAFMRAASTIHRLPDDEVRPYLRATVVNLWRNRLRRLALELRHREERPEQDLSPAFEERDAMWQAICTLPTRQRACVVLRYYEDLTERETATVLGCSVGTVKSQTSRALSRLRRGFIDEP
jgi:RNA polymerase sigma-70 factor (sigma-E family)